MSIEEIKRLNMVELLHDHYGMRFSQSGGQYVSLSPFTDETSPSFFVREVDGHWLFKDFSSGNGGSIIDFVLLKEGFSKVSDALGYLRNLMNGRGVPFSKVRSNTHIKQREIVQTGINGKGKKESKYDVEEIYNRIKTNERDVCREYLKERCIGDEVIDDLYDNGILLHNKYRGRSYCCFAVFDKNEELRCLDNHEIGGDGKFVLGRKEIFTRDWARLGDSEHLFVSEGIIDYLSIKTLAGMSLPGIALLGNVVNVDGSLFKSARLIVSAFDTDMGGVRGLLELREQFPDKEFSVYDFGRCKDANEYLQEVKAGKEVIKLTAQDKLKLYKEFVVCKNKSELALKWGINRSYMYQVVKECEEMIVSGFSQRHRGRRLAGVPDNYDDALAKITLLEEEKRHEAKEKERFYVRSEFMKLRLKWMEAEAADLLSKSGKSHQGQKKQLKKKKKRRP